MREQFRVFCLLTNAGCTFFYLPLGDRAPSTLTYLPIDPENADYVFAHQVESLDGLRHLAAYFKQHERDVRYKDEWTVRMIQELGDLHDASWTEAEKLEYRGLRDDLLARMRAPLD